MLVNLLQSNLESHVNYTIYDIYNHSYQRHQEHQYYEFFVIIETFIALLHYHQLIHLLVKIPYFHWVN